VGILGNAGSTSSLDDYETTVSQRRACAWMRCIGSVGSPSKQGGARGFFEVPFLENSERDFYVHLWWMWRSLVCLPALAIGFLANGKPMWLSAVAYTLCAVVLSFNGHGPYGLEDSLASMVILGDVHHFLHPYVSHRILILDCLLDVGKPIVAAVALAWLGSWFRHRLTIGSSDRGWKQLR
jgi:hypothetical protein